MAQAGGAAALRVGVTAAEGKVDELHGLVDSSPVSRPPSGRRSCSPRSPVAHAEAAELCGVEIGTIRSRVARARVQLVGLVRAAQAG